jgi:cytochrome b561
MVHITSSLHLPANDLARQEIKVAKSLIVSVKKMSAEKEAKAKVEESKAARRWKIGIASVAGAALIGVTGGLAAPLVAASFGAIMGTLGLGAVAGYLGVVAGSSVIVGSIFGAYGARMSGKMMDRYTREVKDFAFIPIRSPPVPSGPDPLAVSAEHRLRVSIAVSGWLTSRADVVNPWRVLGDDSEVFALRFERRALLQLGNSLDRIVKRAAWSIAGRHVIQKTVLAPVLGAVIVPLAFKKVSQLVDNPYRIAQQRAEKAGTILAEAIINKAQGERPLTLIGYSLGARVIYVCLMRLAWKMSSSSAPQSHHRPPHGARCAVSSVAVSSTFSPRTTKYSASCTEPTACNWQSPA